MFLQEIDFAKMYQEHKSLSDFKDKNREEWDIKSKDFALSTQDSPYVNDFISRMQIFGDEVVLDIGCGPGTLAIPLAKRVKEVIAIDFSAKMLQELKDYAEREGITNIKTYHLGWEDDWNKLPKVDIAVASRSMEVQNIHQALIKMNSQAKKACYVTYMAGGSFVDIKILDFIGKKIIFKPDFWYIPALLYSDGYYPTIDYLQTQGSVKRYNKEQFIKSLIWSLGSLTDQQTDKAKEYFDLNINEKTINPKASVWSFISWSPQKESLVKKVV
jgi:SAM-dependent methyltransferase